MEAAGRGRGSRTSRARGRDRQRRSEVAVCLCDIYSKKSEFVVLNRTIVAVLQAAPR